MFAKARERRKLREGDDSGSLPAKDSERGPGLHPDLRSIVPGHARLIQVLLRWLCTLFGALVAVQVGRAVDISSAAGARLPLSWMVWTAVFLLLGGLSGGLAVNQAMRVQVAAERRLREHAQRSWLSLGPLRVQGNAGQLLDLATNGAMRAARYRAGFLSASIASLSAPLVIVAVMGVSLGWRTALLMMLVVVVGPVLIGAFQGMSRGIGDRFRASQSALRTSFLEGIRALETLAYAGAASGYAQRLGQTNEKHRRKIMRLLAGNQLLILVMDLVFSLAALVLATSLAVQGRSDGTLTLGQALTLLMLTLLLVAPVDLIGQFFYIGIGGRAAQREYSSLLYRATEEETERVERTIAPPGALVIEDVVAGWPESRDILRGASLRVRPGERVALVGESGAGKSTLSAVIQGQLQPRGGAVSVPENLAVVEQRAYLFNASIADNLRLARPDVTEQQMWWALERANLASEVRGMPLGLATEVGDQGTGLSGGQGQRIAIARALLKNADLLILDEPTSQVDLAGESLILEAIENASEGRTVLTIAHRPAAVERADRVFQVAGGKITELDGKGSDGR